MKPIHPLHGLVAAAHSPFHEDGSLNLAVVEKQAAHFLRSNVATIGFRTSDFFRVSGIGFRISQLIALAFSPAPLGSPGCFRRRRARRWWAESRLWPA